MLLVGRRPLCGLGCSSTDPPFEGKEHTGRGSPEQRMRVPSPLFVLDLI